MCVARVHGRRCLLCHPLNTTPTQTITLCLYTQPPLVSISEHFSHCHFEYNNMMAKRYCTEAHCKCCEYCSIATQEGRTWKMGRNGGARKSRKREKMERKQDSEIQKSLTLSVRNNTKNENNAYKCNYERRLKFYAACSLSSHQEQQHTPSNERPPDKPYGHFSFQRQRKKIVYLYRKQLLFDLSYAVR